MYSVKRYVAQWALLWCDVRFCDALFGVALGMIGALMCCGVL
jgi:hypothetical protein